MTRDEVGKVIRESIARCRERGIVIREGSWGVMQEAGTWKQSSSSVCPLGAVLLCGPDSARAAANDEALPARAVAAALSVGRHWVWSFMYGVDHGPNLTTSDSEAYNLGQQIIKEVRDGK